MPISTPVVPKPLLTRREVRIVERKQESACFFCLSAEPSGTLKPNLSLLGLSGHFPDPRV